MNKTVLFTIVIIGLFLAACTTPRTERNPNDQNTVISQTDSEANGESAGELPANLGTDSPDWDAEVDVAVSDEEVSI